MSNRIIIHKAVAEDFKLEVFSSAPVDGSSGDYEDGRIIKYLTHFYAWHDASGEWKKFGNSTDITSLETRLSAQEVDQAAAESSLATIDASLQTRISTEESASTSAVDSAEVRAAAAEGVISGNLSSELVDRAADVSAEASRAASAEVILSTNLSSGIVAREADVSVEKARAEAAEGSLQTRLAAEESNELSAETSLDTRASTEESTRLAADNSIAVTVSSEASAARSAETSLQTRLSSEEDRVDAILNAASADKDDFVEIVSFINAIDVAHDAQTSTQISSIDSAIVSAESSRGSADTSIQTRLSIEESTEAAAEASLNTRMAAEASNELSAEGSLDVRSSAEESLRLAEDTSLETSLSGAGSSRAAGDSSLTTAASVEASTARSAEVSVQSSLSAAALARGNADTSLQTRLSIEESAMIVAVDSIEALRSAGDLSLTTRVSSEEVTRAAGDSSLTTRTGVAESARSTADSSLTTRLAAEESNELSAETSLDTRVSSEASAQVLADGSLQTRFSGELSTERSKLDSILDSAAADKDTFVEIVSFITSVDTESDDALASYVVAVDATISTEVSTARSAEAVLSTNLSSEVSAMGSAVAATYATISGNIATHATAIDTKEQHEGVGRHMRLDFTSETSFSVAAVDLPTNFEPGNGMAQVFQLVSAGVYRHLVAPSTYNATTGVMSFDLGSTAKSGFVVFYSFAGDEAEVTEPSSAALFQFAVSSTSYDANAPEEISETYAGSENKSSINIVDLDNASYTVTNEYGYDQYTWTLNTPFSQEYDSGTSTYTNHFLTWGSPGDTGAYIRWYSQESTDGGSSWSSTQYTDTTVTIDGTSGYVSGTQGVSFPSSSPAVPAQGPAVGSAFKMWAEGYDVNGDCIFKAGSESAPYYNLDSDHDFKFQSGSHYVSSSIYWHSSAGDGLPSVFGQTRSLTLSMPSSLSVGDNYTSSIANFNANYNSSNYGWSSYGTSWALTGTDAAEFDIKPYTSGDQQSASSTGDVSIMFKEGSSSSNRLVPSSGTYSVTLTATNSGGSDVVWNISIVI